MPDDEDESDSVAVAPPVGPPPLENSVALVENFYGVEYTRCGFIFIFFFVYLSYHNCRKLLRRRLH